MNKLMFLCLLTVGCASTKIHTPIFPHSLLGALHEKIACSPHGANQQICASTSPHPLETAHTCVESCCKWKVPLDKQEVDGLTYALKGTEQWCFKGGSWELKQIDLY